MRWIMVLVALAACSDLRDFRGVWEGPRVGTANVVKVGAPTANTASLRIDDIDQHGIVGELSVPGLVMGAHVESVPGAEADALAGMTFSGSPLRVYLAFLPMTDGAGDALALIALYDHQRIEVRVLRGGAEPLYAIFALAEETE